MSWVLKKKRTQKSRIYVGAYGGYTARLIIEDILINLFSKVDVKNLAR